MKCKKCDGVGFIFRYSDPHDSYKCPVCKGKGEIKMSNKLSYKSRDKEIIELSEALTGSTLMNEKLKKQIEKLNSKIKIYNDALTLVVEETGHREASMVLLTMKANS